MESLVELLPLIIPVVLIDIAFRIYAIIDILKEERKVRWDNKIVWIVGVAIVSYGWIIYFLIGRDE